MNPGSTTWTLASPHGPGAVAIVQLHGDIDAALQSCNIAPVPTGAVKLRNLLDIDRGIVARFAPDMAQLMPHGGVAVVRALLAELTTRGILEAQSPHPRDLFPEARSEVEAHALAALARAPSPLAVDLLLAQHDLWSNPTAASAPTRDRILNRLIDPPLVVALGASNIGKSTLVNALAGRAVSVVADEPGTTRDHVGVMLDLAGLVVRYVDTPGLRVQADAVEQEAVNAALKLASTADLLLLCGDATAPPPPLPPAFLERPRLFIALRSDLGPAHFQSNAAVCARTGQGMSELVALVKETLLPQALLESKTPWRFWRDDG